MDSDLHVLFGFIGQGAEEGEACQVPELCNQGFSGCDAESVPEWGILRFPLSVLTGLLWLHVGRPHSMVAASQDSQ